MTAPSVFVVGAEGSGTTLLWRCIAAHPELREIPAAPAPSPELPVNAPGVIMHLSLPTLRPMQWVPPEDLPPGARVVIVRRSPVHTVYSAYRRFYDQPRDAWRTYFHAMALEARYVAVHDPLCICYEDLVGHPAKVLRGVYEWLGVRGDVRPPIRLRDRNDDRWRADSGFAEFMGAAFGEVDGAASTHLASAAAVDPPPPRVAVAAAADAPRVAPARYVRVDDLLTPQEHARLLRFVRAREHDFAASSLIGTDRTERVDPGFRRSGMLSDLEDVWAVFDTRLRRLLPHVRRELALAWFPLGRIERQMTVHCDGDFFRAHADNTDPAVADRRVTCVYYFHRRPKRFTGGELRLYDTVVHGDRAEIGQHYVSVDPADNTAVFFTSDVYHEVRPVHRQSDAFHDSRFSVSVWFWQGETPSCLSR